MSRRALVIVALGAVTRVAAADIAPPIFPPPPSTPTPAPTPATPSPPPTPAPTATVTAKPVTTKPATAPAGDADKPLITDEEEGPPKLSLASEADRVAWRRPGFRLGLGFSYGELHGLRGAPSGRLLGPTLRLGIRLDESWSLLASFQYAQASRDKGLSGLRFAGTIDPTWHVLPSLSLSLGLGFGGIVEGDRARDVDAMPAADTLETSYTFPDASSPMASCSGVGVAGLARAEYALVLGPRTELTIAAELVGQWTGCVDDSGNVEPDTGDAIVRRQWWPHIGGSLTAGFAWR